MAIATQLAGGILVMCQCGWYVRLSDVQTFEFVAGLVDGHHADPAAPPRA